MGDEKTPERGDLIVVYWWDIEDDPNWKPINLVEIEQLPLCKSVGWFINRDDSCIRLAFSVNGTEDAGLEVGRTLIPTAVIRNVELIREDELGAE